MATDLPSASYLALYILSIHVLDSNSRTSTHWRLNGDTGKVEVAALAADGDANTPPDDPLMSLLSSRVTLANGEWKLEASSSTQQPSSSSSASSTTCSDSCRNVDKNQRKSSPTLSDNKNRLFYKICCLNCRYIYGTLGEFHGAPEEFDIPMQLGGWNVKILSKLATTNPNPIPISLSDNFFKHFWIVKFYWD